MKQWKGNTSESWTQIIPERPEVFDWRKKNVVLFRDVQDAHDASHLIRKVKKLKPTKDNIDSWGKNKQKSVTEYNVKKSLIKTGMDGDRNQKITQENLSQRCMNIHTYMKLLEEAIDKLNQDIHVIQSRKGRLRSAMLGVHLVDRINKECLHIRSLRMEQDNLNDAPYTELIKESNLVQDLNTLMSDTLSRMNNQLQDSMAIKSKLQLDWSNKKQAFDIDQRNLSLNIKSDSILFRASSARIPDDQSTPISWESYTLENLNEAELILARSSDLISFLDGPVLSQYVKQLRIQADKVNNELTSKVCSVDKRREDLEHELQMVVNHLGETETVIEDLRNLIRNLEKALKVAQTRLDNRLARIGVENCRDDVQEGLLEEVKCLTNQISTSLMQLKQTETTQNGLLYSRNQLEYEIQVKRKSISVDNERCTRVRQHYPALTTLSGH